MEKLKINYQGSLFLVFFALFIFLSNKTVAQIDEVYGKIQFDTLEFELGTIKDGIKTIEVHYTNLGPGELTIYHAVTPCTCTTVTFNKAPITKEKKGIITIHIDPEKLPKGPFTRNVTILHDGSDKGFDQITINGNIP